jgi:hypothetical protein
MPRIIWTGLGVMTEMRNEYRILIGTPEGRAPLGEKTIVGMAY